jgi:hypothetical protein
MVSKYGMNYSGTGYRYMRAVIVIVMYFVVLKMPEFPDELGKSQFLNMGPVPWRLSTQYFLLVFNSKTVHGI